MLRVSRRRRSLTGVPDSVTETLPGTPSKARCRGVLRLVDDCGAAG
jgi:hypothetical protein